jgi:TRAP-type transport system small permease protein
VRQVLKWTDSVVLGAATVMSAGFLVCVALQVFFRYVLQQSLVWSEELSVYLFIWSSLLAAAIVVGTGEHFSISYFVEWLPPRGRRILDVGITLLCIIFALLVVTKGAEWSWRMRSAVSNVLQVSQGAVYTIIPLSALYMLFHLIVRLARLLSGQQTDDGRPC